MRFFMEFQHQSRELCVDCSRLCNRSHFYAIAYRDRINQLIQVQTCLVMRKVENFALNTQSNTDRTSHLPSMKQ